MKKSILCLIILGFLGSLNAQTKRSKRQYKKESITTNGREDETPLDKEKKYTFYVGLTRPIISAATSESWSGVYREYFTTNDIFNTYQDKSRTSYLFSSLNGYNIGINKNIRKNEKLTLFYGIGANITLFSYSSTSKTIEHRVIDKIEVIQKGIYIEPIEIVTPINPRIGDNDNYYFTPYYIGSVEHRTIAISFPMGLQYKLISKLYAEANVAVLLPVSVKTTGLSYNFRTGEDEVIINNNSTVINRILYCGSLGLHFRFRDDFNVGFKYNYTFNSLFNSSNQVRNEYDEIGTVKLSSTELTLGCNF